jgi:hypothetical protein
VFRRTFLTFVALASLVLPIFADANITAQLSVQASVIRNASIPRGAQRVPMLSLKLTTTCGGTDVTLQSIRLMHQGLGDSADIASIYALYLGERITRGFQISHADSAVSIRFSNFMIPACSTKEIIIAADFSTDAVAGGEHRLVLENAQDVNAGGVAVTSTIVISPEIARTVGYREGNIGATYLKLAQIVRYGRNRTVARFRLEADSISDQLIRSIMVTNTGTASDGDLQNLFFQASRGQKLTTKAVQMEGDHVTLLFDPPYLLPKGQDKVLELHADVFASRKRTIGFVIKEPSDIQASAKTGRP